MLFLSKFYKKTALFTLTALTAATLSGCALWNNQSSLTAGSSGTDAASSSENSAVSAIGMQSGDSKEFNSFLMELFNEQITGNSIDFHYSLEHPENYGLSMDEVTFGTVDLADMDASLEETKAALKKLEAVTEEATGKEEGKVQSEFYHFSVVPAMEGLRTPVDELEMIVDKEVWPMPSYGDLLFEV